MLALALCVLPKRLLKRRSRRGRRQEDEVVVVVFSFVMNLI